MRAALNTVIGFLAEGGEEAVEREGRGYYLYDLTTDDRALPICIRPGVPRHARERREDHNALQAEDESFLFFVVFLVMGCFHPSPCWDCSDTFARVRIFLIVIEVR